MLPFYITVTFVTLYLMVNEPLSDIVPIEAVNQLVINIIAVDKEGTIKLSATPSINSQSSTVRFFLLFLYCIDSMFMLFARTIAKHD